MTKVKVLPRRCRPQKLYRYLRSAPGTPQRPICTHIPRTKRIAQRIVSVAKGTVEQVISSRTSLSRFLADIAGFCNFRQRDSASGLCRLSIQVPPKKRSCPSCTLAAVIAIAAIRVPGQVAAPDLVTSKVVQPPAGKSGGDTLHPKPDGLQGKGTAPHRKRRSNWGSSLLRFSRVLLGEVASEPTHWSASP
jgi:hypothetical protein